MTAVLTSQNTTWADIAFAALMAVALVAAWWHGKRST